MTRVLVDSNVLLDIATDDKDWAEWPGSTLERLADVAVLVINPIIYAKVSVASRRSRRSKLPFRASSTFAKISRTKVLSLPESPSCDTDEPVERGDHRFPTSTSAHMLRSPAIDSSRETRLDTGRISQRST